MKWSLNEIEILRKKYCNLNISVDEMSKELNRSVDSISWKARKLKLNRKKLIKRKDKSEYDKKYKSKHQELINERQKLRKHNIRKKLITMLGGKCAFCGEDRFPCLDFHHRNPSNKKFNISNGLSRYSMEKLIHEAKKCILLCANCHRVEHFNQKAL